MKIFHLSEPKHGWIEVTFGSEGNSYTIAASDVPNDCLRDLAEATLRLLAGSSSQELVEFSLEPDYAECHLSPEGEHLGIRIVMPDAYAQNPACEFSGPLNAFARDLLSELLKVRASYSTDDWTHDSFPEAEAAALAEALRSS